MSDFKQFMEDVDLVIARTCGLSSSDLADQCYRDFFDDGMDPTEVATLVLEGEGFEFDN